MPPSGLVLITFSASAEMRLAGGLGREGALSRWRARRVWEWARQGVQRALTSIRIVIFWLQRRPVVCAVISFSLDSRGKVDESCALQATRDTVVRIND